ncbi:MAG: hypothetical protein ACHQEB_06125 [Chitinophagales bacterium]
MEVHHPHQPTHKKKWTEYLLEFFMLFFAVFLGFLTENKREQFSEHKKERYLIESLGKDLENDTATLNHVITNMDIHNTWVDSAVICLNSEQIAGKEKLITNALENATIWVTYTAPDVAINEIRNSGNFNLIRNESVKRGILNYIKNLNRYIEYSTTMNDARHSMDTSTVSILTIRDLRTLTNMVYEANNNGRDFIDISDFVSPIHFKTYNLFEFKRLAEKLERLNYLETDMLGQYQRLYFYDVWLLKLLQKEYHLKE